MCDDEHFCDKSSRCVLLSVDLLQNCVEKLLQRLYEREITSSSFSCFFYCNFFCGLHSICVEIRTQRLEPINDVTSLWIHNQLLQLLSTSPTNYCFFYNVRIWIRFLARIFDDLQKETSQHITESAPDVLLVLDRIIACRFVFFPL